MLVSRRWEQFLFAVKLEFSSGAGVCASQAFDSVTIKDRMNEWNGWHCKYASCLLSDYAEAFLLSAIQVCFCTIKSSSSSARASRQIQDRILITAVYYCGANLSVLFWSIAALTCSRGICWGRISSQAKLQSKSSGVSKTRLRQVQGTSCCNCCLI